MKLVVIGAHLERGDVEPLAESIAVDDLYLSGLPVAGDQPLGDRDLLLRVAEIRAALLDRATFIAVRYGFAAHGRTDALAKCAPHLERWRRVLRDCRGMVEMTLKVAAAAPRAKPDRRDFTSGAGYLRALHDATRAAGADPGFRDAVDARVGKIAVRHRWSARDTASVECALLVRRGDVDAVNAAGAELKTSFSSTPFLLSGPWPLEVFADDHE